MYHVANVELTTPSKSLKNGILQARSATSHASFPNNTYTQAITNATAHIATQMETQVPHPIQE